MKWIVKNFNTNKIEVYKIEDNKIIRLNSEITECIKKEEIEKQNNISEEDQRLLNLYKEFNPYRND